MRTALFTNKTKKKLLLLVALTLFVSIHSLYSQSDTTKSEKKHKSFGLSFTHADAFSSEVPASKFYGAEFSIYWHLFPNKKFYFVYDYGFAFGNSGDYLGRIPIGSAIGPLFLIASAKENDTTNSEIMVGLGIISLIVPNGLGYHLKINTHQQINFVFDPLNFHWRKEKGIFASGISFQYEYSLSKRFALQCSLQARQAFGENGFSLLQLNAGVKF